MKENSFYIEYNKELKSVKINFILDEQLFLS